VKTSNYNDEQGHENKAENKTAAKGRD
jgi:hypothetical protein